MKSKFKFILCVFILFFTISCLQKRKETVADNDQTIESEIDLSDSNLPPDKKWELVWHDEFDGNTLDTTKWDFRLHLLQTRHKCWTKEGAYLDGNGNLILELYEKDGHYYCSALQTGENYLDRPGRRYSKTLNSWPIDKLKEAKFMHKYGYYEIRCKLPTQPGWWPAFWLQSPIIGSTLDPGFSGVEIDIMEYFNREGRIRHSVIWNGYGPDIKSDPAGDRFQEGVTEGYHTYGVDWSPDGYVFYVDGRETYRSNKVVSHTEQFILVTTECQGYRKSENPSEELKNAILPDYFIVDYVRVFDEIK